MNTATATLLVISILFGLMLFKSRRFVEYFPAFALLFCAVAWAPLLDRWSRSHLRLGRVLPVILTLGLIPAIWGNVQATRTDLQESKPYQQYAAASVWLAANTPPGSRVFQTDWDDFTRLFYYNTHNTYTVGLDPTYLQLSDPDLYDLWVDITRGRIERPARTIDETFGARVIITDLKHESFIREAEADPYLEEVYRDEFAAIFQVVD
jgi:hypothetical protein